MPYIKAASVHVEWLKDIIARFWKIIIIASTGVYTAFNYLFEPTEAWGAVWKMFLASFITKMVELLYDSEKGRWSWTSFKNKFSASTGFHKAAPKMLLFLLLMFVTGLAKYIFPQAVVDSMHFTSTAIFFTLELINSVQHLGKLPALSKLATAFAIFIKELIMPLMPKGFHKLLDESEGDKDDNSN